MALRQKRHRRIRFRPPEWMLAILLLVTILAALFCLPGLHTRQWEETTGHIISVGGGTPAWSQEESAAPQSTNLRLRIRYTVNGVEHYGEKELGRASQLIMQALPQNIREKLAAQGVLTMAGVPKEIRTVLKHKGMTSLDDAPAQVLAVANTYQDGQAIPTHLKEAAKARDYTTIAQAIDTALTDAPDEQSTTQVPATNTPQQTITWEQEDTSTTTALTSLAKIQVRYDPYNPAQYQVSTLGIKTGWLALFILVASTIATLFYGIKVYPNLKYRLG